MRKTQKIALSRETLRRLDHDSALRNAAGGALTAKCAPTITCNGASICEGYTCPAVCKLSAAGNCTE
jgi:hypothetical protein